MIKLIFEIVGIITFVLIDIVIIRNYFQLKKEKQTGIRSKSLLPNFKFNLHWILIIAFTIFIILTPWIFTSSAILEHFDFSETGGIGDTINGIAGTFIAWMGAILIFITFREQVKANKNLKNQNDFNIVLQNLNKLQENPFNINQLCQNATVDINNKTYNSQDLKRVSEIIRDFQNMIFLIENVTENKNILKTKIFLVWDSMYKPEIEKLNTIIVTLVVVGGISFIIGNPWTFNQDYVDICQVSQRCL